MIVSILRIQLIILLLNVEFSQILFLKYEDLVNNPYDSFLLVLKYLKNYGR